MGRAFWSSKLYLHNEYQMQICPLPLRDPICPLDFFALSETEQERCFASTANAKQASSRMPRICSQADEAQAIHAHFAAVIY